MRSDTMSILIKDITPYEICDVAKIIIDSLGNRIFNFGKTNITGNYYVVVKHRNSIETWSKTGGVQLYSFFQPSYDFTTDLGQT